MDDLNPAVRSLWRLIHVLDCDLVDGRSQQEVIQTVDRQGSQREVQQTVDRTNSQRQLTEAFRQDSKHVMAEEFHINNHQWFADNNQTFADFKRDGIGEFVDNWTCVKRGNYSQTYMTDQQAPCSRNMPHVQRCVVSPSTAFSGPIPRIMSINSPSALQHQGWLTDQLRGRRVWCNVSVNQLCMFQGKDSTVARQVILLPICSVRCLVLKSSNQRGKAHNGIARRFMSTSVPRLDQYHFLLENLRTGQHFLFGVDTQCELSQWWAILDKVCSLHSDTDVADSQTPGHSYRTNDQLKHASSDPQISTHLAQDQLADPTTSFTAKQLVANTTYPAQSDHAKTDPVQSDHAKVDLVQSDHSKVDLLQSDRAGLDMVQIDHEKTDLVQHEEKTDLVQHGEKTHLVQHGEKTNLVQRGEETDLAQRGEETDLFQYGEKTDLIQHGEKTDLVQRGEKTHLVQRGEKTDLVQHGEETDLFQYGEKTDSLENLRRICDKPGSSNRHSLSVKVNHEMDNTVNHDVNYNVNYGTNYSAHTKTSGSCNHRHPRPVLRITPSMSAVFPRRTRSAPTGNSRQAHSLSDLQTHGHIAYSSRALKADSSDLDLETGLHEKRSFDARHYPQVASHKQHGHSMSLSFSFRRLAATIFEDNTFYKDVIPKPAGRTLRDLKEVCLSGHLLFAAGCSLRLVYCVLSRGSLYMFSSATPGALLERSVALNQYTVTYGSEMHERKRSLFLLKLTEPGGDSLCMYAETQQALLTWLMAMQSASVRLQSVEDLVSEMRESKQAVDVMSSRGQCVHNCGSRGSDQWQSCVHVNVPVADLSPQEVLVDGNASECSEPCNLSTLTASEFSEPCKLSTLTASEFSEPCKLSTLTESSGNSIDTPLQLVMPDSLGRLGTPPRLESIPDLFNSYHMSLDCDQRESSSLCEMSTDVLHKDSTETWSGRIAADTSIVAQCQPQSARSIRSPTPTSASFLTASTTIREAGVQHVGPGVCPRSLQAVSISEHQSVAVSQHHHKVVSCSAVAHAYITNHNTVLDTRDVMSQSLFNNLDQSMRDVYQPYEFQSLVHDDAVKRAWATTEQSLLEVVKDKLRQRERRGLLQTDPCKGCHDVCIAEDDWNLAATNMVQLGVSGDSCAASSSCGSHSLDDDNICSMTMLLQRRMSTQIQLNVVHSQREDTRGSSKKKNNLFQIGKKKPDLVQGRREMNSQRADLEEQARILSVQVQELDKCLASCGSPRPVDKARSKNRRWSHSYDLKDIHLTTKADTSSCSSGNRQKLKDKVGELYRSLSLKSTVQKFAQKTLSKAKWHMNTKFAHVTDDKTSEHSSLPTTSDGLPVWTASVTDIRGARQAGQLDWPGRPLLPNRCTPRESKFINSTLPGRCPARSSLPSLTHLETCTSNIHMSASSSLTKLSLKQENATCKCACDTSVTSPLTGGDVLDATEVSTCIRVGEPLPSEAGKDTTISSGATSSRAGEDSLATPTISGGWEDSMATPTISGGWEDSLATPTISGGWEDSMATPTISGGRENAVAGPDKRQVSANALAEIQVTEVAGARPRLRQATELPRRQAGNFRRVENSRPVPPSREPRVFSSTTQNTLKQVSTPPPPSPTLPPFASPRFPGQLFTFN